MFKKHLILFAIIIVSVGRFSENAHAQNAEKISVAWIDPLKSIESINSRVGVIALLNKIRVAGFKAVALEVKTVSGEVIFSSEIAPRLFQWQDKRLPAGYDPVRLFIDEARSRNLQIYVVFPLFSEGHMLERQGPIFEDRSHWQTTVYVVEEEKPTLKPIVEWRYGSLAFANPLSREVQDYEISLVKEFLEIYTVDGIIFDKGRFYSIESDFSEDSKRQFESYLGQGAQIDWWPEDIYELQFVNDEWQIVPGKYYTEWIAFRSEAMRSFFQRLLQGVEQKDPSLPVGNFVGAWYPQYYEYGVNWASSSNLPEEEWASRDYYKTAIAELFDYLIVGSFFPRIEMATAENLGAEWWMSVEGSATIAMEVVDNVCPVYASILAPLFKDDPEKFKEALKAALDLTDGLYVHDVRAIEQYEFWDEITDVLRGEAQGERPPIDF